MMYLQQFGEEVWWLTLGRGSEKEKSGQIKELFFLQENVVVARDEDEEAGGIKDDSQISILCIYSLNKYLLNITYRMLPWITGIHGLVKLHPSLKDSQSSEEKEK